MNRYIEKARSEILVTLIMIIMGFTALSYSINTHANTSNDAQVFSIFDQFNSQDIELAVLAVTRGHSEAVGMVGNMIINDHIPLLKEMRKMAKHKGLNIENHENERALAHKAMMNSLLNKKGEAFDKAYLDYELKFSQDFVKTLKESIIPNIDDPKFKTFLSSTLVRFEEHLSHINHAAMMMNSNNGKSNEAKHGHSHEQ